ncbi:MAG: peptidyl-tRNA hydrolase Pth2 [Candidatus Korarchaeota archaeon]
MKLVIVVRKDLKMGKGKLAVEVAHASVRAALESPQNYVKKWISEGERKVVVWAESLEHLHELASRARSEGLPVFVISDAGRTQVPSSTITCIAIGPSPEWKVDKITGNLKLIS